VDVLATLGDGLHVIEVTTRKSEKGVEDKLVKLQQIRTALNADVYKEVTGQEAPKPAGGKESKDYYARS
jgi:hypothetical protein